MKSNNLKKLYLKRKKQDPAFSYTVLGKKANVKRQQAWTIVNDGYEETGKIRVAKELGLDL